MRIAAIIFLLVSGCFISEINAQSEMGPTVLELDEAIRMALLRNPWVHNADLEIEAARKSKKSAVNLPNPEIEYNQGQINSTLTDYNWYINQELSFPTVYSSAKKYQQEVVGLNERRAEITRNDLVRDVKHAYLFWIILYQKNEIIKMIDSLATRFDYASKIQYEMGEIDKLNRLVAETKAMQIKHMMNENLADIGIAEKELKILLNTDQEFLPPEDALIRLNVSISGDSAWVTANPAMRALNQQINVLEASVKNEKMKAFPDLKVGYFNQSIDHTKGFQGWQVAVKIPLWYWSYDGNIQSSKIQQEIAQNTFDYEQKTLYLRMQQMQQRIEKYRGSVNYYEEAALAQSDQLLLVANMSYYEGEIGYIEYLNNARDAIQIKLEYLDALNNYNQTVIEIEYLLGNPGPM